MSDTVDRSAYERLLRKYEYEFQLRSELDRQREQWQRERLDLHERIDELERANRFLLEENLRLAPRS